MRTKETYLEVVEYNLPEMLNTSKTLIRDFADYSEVRGARQWIWGMLRLKEIITERKPTAYYFKADGLEIIFSGFPNPRPLIEDDRVVFRASDPRFVLRDTVLEDGLLPSQRNDIEKSVFEISKEMRDVYKLRVEDLPDRTLTFPRDVYGKTVTIFNAALLQA